MEITVSGFGLGFFILFLEWFQKDANRDGHAGSGQRGSVGHVQVVILVARAWIGNQRRRIPDQRDDGALPSRDKTT